MKKILLFGTSEGAQRYLSKYEEEFEVVAVFDNNIEKQGTFFLDKYLISSPLKIKEFEYEELIIVSQWSKEIYHQLVNDLNIEPSKIVVPKKTDLKVANRPFEDEKTRNFARDIVKRLSTIAIEDGIELVVDFGTLLGIIRDEDIIEWDDDVDFSVINLSQDFDFSSWIKLSIEKIRLPIKTIIKTAISKDKIVNYVIEFEESNFNKFIVTIDFREEKDNYSIHLSSNGLWYAPKQHFESCETIIWQDVKIQVPKDYENYLTFVYGDWKIPKKDISFNDYANLGYVNKEGNKTSYEDFKSLNIERKEIK